jgi:hypothetical protein
MTMDFSRSDSQRIKRYCICNEMDGREDKEGDANVCTEYKSISSEFDTKDGNCETVDLIHKMGIVKTCS